jgi:hypothetical protein
MHQGVSLAGQEKTAFRHFLGLLLDAEEPEATLDVLQRLAERKAYGAVRGVISIDDAERWLRLAKAQALLDRAQCPLGGSRGSLTRSGAGAIIAI